jgi:hypothetical protein
MKLPKFNNGKPYHGSAQISAGRLDGATGETDYFYFFCPKRPHREITRILEYGEHAKEAINEHNVHCKSEEKYRFTLAFNLYCEKCGHSDRRWLTK